MIRPKHHRFQQLQARMSSRPRPKHVARLSSTRLARMTESEHRLLAYMQDMEHRLRTQMHDEIARHTKATCESMLAVLGIIDDKYSDLPRRVKRLEDKVFTARRR
jgi:hypothetical protein